MLKSQFDAGDDMVKKTVRYRSAETGEYITKKEAEKNPKQSVKETDPAPKPKK